MLRHRKTAVSGFLGGCVHSNVPVVPNRIAALDSGLTEEMRARRSTLQRLILFLRYAYRWRAVCRRYSNASAMQPFFDGCQNDFIIRFFCYGTWDPLLIGKSS